MSARRLAISLALFTLSLGVIAHADIAISKKVQAKFRGKILITTEPLPDAADTPGETISTYNKLNRAEVTGTANGEVTAWTFYYTAFMKKAPGVTSISIDFHTADKQQLYVANKTLQVDASSKMFTGRLTIDEDEGPTKGRTYHVILRARKGKKEIELARTKLTLK